MNTFFKNIMLTLLELSALTITTSCLNNDDKTIGLETPSTGIPDDTYATANPSVSSTTTTIPNIQAIVDNINGIPIIRLIMTGVKNPDSSDWLRLYGTNTPGQNIWVEVDNVPKGILVNNNGDNYSHSHVMTDVVFTVDNSSSMKDEADAIARDIISWAQLLSNSGLDARFASVGYGGYISGAINLTTAAELSNYLNQKTGTSRTIGYGGSDANLLSSYASAFPTTGYALDYNECGTMAIQFADKYFSFRHDANRIYVNFTDEPNQPNGHDDYSVKFFESQTNWPSSKGTVHTVFSGTKPASNTFGSKEQPWLISQYTGGTTLYAPSNFSGVTLANLPVTGAMENSYTITFSNISELVDGKSHLVHITIKSKDNTVSADKTFSMTFK